ncbi:Guanine/hypoxanthine permease PbuG [Posidoniimonas polymericola]|uniref:Guanine/hypoxanthine permease PbuG n=1 Tax=Posidoniimonas polymericola TaxID=2528002 RepID=A0A5C5YSE0_9BACT|nr:NCS2 family permease [Posidoniimonas polymericola]TWT77865.1 Guanine/hypoxanthine permease PbuG [Posidoniimonas polymericola]
MPLRYLLSDNLGRPTSVGVEARGALTTFLTMAYILPVNAGILAAAVGEEQQGSLVACTALAAGICCLLMGLVANAPIALASGMGLNALIAFNVAAAAGSWQAAMGLVVVEGLVILALVLLGMREAVLDAIPRSLRLAIGAGIGLFIALIGLSNAGIVVQGVPAPPAGPLLAPGDVREPATAIALAGLAITAALLAWRVKGALLLGILATTAIAAAAGQVAAPTGWGWPSFGVALQADVLGALKWELVPLLFAVMMVDFFDTLGTATAVAEEGGLLDERGRIPAARRLLAVDSLSASIGGLLGVSSVTSYIESAAGVAEGARTGLHAVFVGLLFLLAVFLAPLAAVVPAAATAPALILVGFLMLRQLAELDFERLDEAIPAFLTLLTIPLTFSIAHGIGYGVLAHVLIKLLRGRWSELNLLMFGIAAAFAAYFVLAG